HKTEIRVSAAAPPPHNHGDGDGSPEADGDQDNVHSDVTRRRRSPARSCPWNSLRPEAFLVGGAGSLGGGAGIVLFLLQPYHFAARRFLIVEAHGLERGLLREAVEGRVRHDEAERSAVRRGSEQRHGVTGVS